MAFTSFRQKLFRHFHSGTGQNQSWIGVPNSRPLLYALCEEAEEAGGATAETIAVPKELTKHNKLHGKMVFVVILVGQSVGLLLFG